MVLQKDFGLAEGVHRALELPLERPQRRVRGDVRLAAPRLGQRDTA
jgi:hypothetical protein